MKKAIFWIFRTDDGRTKFSPQARPQVLMQALDLTEEQTHRILQPQSTAKMLPFWQTIRLYQSVYARLGSGRGRAGEKARRSTH